MGCYGGKAQDGGNPPAAVAAALYGHDDGLWGRYPPPHPSLMNCPAGGEAAAVAAADVPDLGVALGSAPRQSEALLSVGAPPWTYQQIFL